MGRAKAHVFSWPPRALGRNQKVRYHLISITKSISNILIPNFVYVLKNKETNHIRRDFYSVAWVIPQGWDFVALGVPRRSKIYFFQTWSCVLSNQQG